MPAGNSLKRLAPRAGVAFASAARTATPTPATIDNRDGHSGLEVTIDCTAVTDTPSVTFAIQQYDIASGKWTQLLISAAVTGTGTTRLRVHPALTETANVDAADVLGRQLRVVPTHGDADSITYSVGYQLVA